MTTQQALHFLEWKDTMQNRIKLRQQWQGDTVRGHAKVEWYWETDLSKLK